MILVQWYMPFRRMRNHKGKSKLDSTRRVRYWCSTNLFLDESPSDSESENKAIKNGACQDFGFSS